MMIMDFWDKNKIQKISLELKGQKFYAKDKGGNKGGSNV